MESPRLPIGERIRYYRNKRHRTQSAVAGLCGITEAYLSQIERGLKIPSTELLARIARELGVPLAALLTDEPEGADMAPQVTADPAITSALVGCGTPDIGEPPTPAALRERVEAAWRIWQTSPTRFTEAATVLPDLVTDVERAVRVQRQGTDRANRREILRTAADLYGLLRSYCRRAGRVDLALMVADRAIRAAEDADDPIRIAAGHWNLGHALLSHDLSSAVDEAEEVAKNAIDQLGDMPSTPQAAAVRGALELVIVVAAARRKQWWEARRRLQERAAPLAQRCGESNVMWTVFGPINVELHAVSIEMLAGEASEGLRLADQVDVSGVPSKEREFTFGLEVARCCDIRREDAAMLVHLLSLEQLAPEDLRRNPVAHAMIVSLLRRARPTFRRQVTDLAERLQLT